MRNIGEKKGQILAKLLGKKKWLNKQYKLLNFLYMQLYFEPYERNSSQRFLINNPVLFRAF